MTNRNEPNNRGRGSLNNNFFGSSKRSNNSSRSIVNGKRQANIFATRFGPNVQPTIVKRNLEDQLRRITGEHHEVNVEKIESRYDTYSSFHITCICSDPNVFRNAQLWPTDVFVRWWRKSHNDNILVGNNN